MRFIKNVFGIACIIFGIGLFAYPVATTQYSAYQTEKYIREYDDAWQSSDNQTKKKKKALLQEAHAYNASIYAEKQEGFCDAWSYTQPPFHLKGLKDGKFGYIKIPAMDVKLPLYIGASKENLSKGAAVLGQTSLPVGGTNTNCIIAGHRGYQGIPYFREIERLEVGDKVSITNPWETLTYRVESMAIIDPYDNDAVKIQDGKDMVTLVTCHPYRSHGKYRYIVYCVRDTGKEKLDDTTSPSIRTEDDITFVSSGPDIKREQFLRKVCAGILFLLFIVTIIRHILYKRGHPH